MLSKNNNFKDKNKYFCKFGRFLEKEYKIESTWNGKFSRLLEKHEIHYELKNHGKREKLTYNKISMDSKKGKDDISTYRNIKRSYLNDLDAYKKRYKNRYSRKKGLAKLDCYFEKKVFDNVDHINDLAEKWQGGKNTFIKKISKKIAILFIPFAILPVIGITLNVLFKAEKGKDAIIPWCRYKNCGDTPSCHLKDEIYHFNRPLLESFLLLSNVLWYTSIIIFIIFVIYIFIKVIKYEKLKSSKGKMGVKEYCRFCKDVFNNKINK
ncbi:Plasmodium exported protein, unknown function [Plasmodium vivax]|uniref:Variable surface protein Vir35 n=1 Tax=Plasmodium vivax TaxID=5855 RepID=A0A565A721_PLAVI|nr:Plasmodium exported protein, unknown function [Plasmodium vivax]